MTRKRLTAEQIIMKPRAAEVGLAQGKTVVEACKLIGMTGQTYYRWRNECGGLRMDQAKLPLSQALDPIPWRELQRVPGLT